MVPTKIQYAVLPKWLIKVFAHNSLSLSSNFFGGSLIESRFIEMRMNGAFSVVLKLNTSVEIYRSCFVLVTRNCVELPAPLGGSTWRGGQEVRRFCDWEFHYRAHKCPSLVTEPNQFSPSWPILVMYSGSTLDLTPTILSKLRFPRIFPWSMWLVKTHHGHSYRFPSTCISMLDLLSAACLPCYNNSVRNPTLGLVKKDSLACIRMSMSWGIWRRVVWQQRSKLHDVIFHKTDSDLSYSSNKVYYFDRIFQIYHRTQQILWRRSAYLRSFFRRRRDVFWDWKGFVRDTWLSWNSDVWMASHPSIQFITRLSSCVPVTWTRQQTHSTPTSEGF
jgi:hypothetical protein